MAGRIYPEVDREGTAIMPSMEERFWAKVNKTENCWLWTGSMDKYGYGRFKVRGKLVLAHRFAYELARGLIPGELETDHLCRNRRCIKVDHLEAVTHQVNSLRGFGVGAQNARRPACLHGHLFDLLNTHFLPDCERVCRICDRERHIKMRAQRNPKEKP